MRLEFGHCVFDSETREVFRKGKPVHLSPKAFRVLELLLELNREGTTIVVITHNRDIAASLPRQVELRDGRIVRDGAAGAVEARVEERSRA